MLRAARRAQGWAVRRTVLALLTTSSAAWAGIGENAEDRIDEARARPTPVAQQGNWVVVPIPVANPTVGNGLQVAALYLHAKKPGQERAPSSTSGAALMATDQKARLVGLFHDGSLANDRYRISAFGGVGEFHLKYHGVGDDSALASNPLPYSMEGTLAQVRAEARLPDTEYWFAGMTYQYLDSTFTFEASQVVPGLPDLPGRFHSAGLGPHISYDSRDSNYFPLSGRQFRAGWVNYAPRWGGDFSFNKVDVFYNHYLRFGAASVLGLRAHVQGASEGTPFIFMPTLDMRGFSRDRYRDAYTLSLVAEWRQKFAPRWGYVAYAEAGRFASSWSGLSDGRTITTLGTGLRWQATAERDMHIGVDVAVSTDDRAVFIQIGERF